MDDSDLATLHEEQERERALRYRMPDLKPAGLCFFCGEKLHTYMLFCDSNCRDDYEKQLKARKRNGA